MWWVWPHFSPHFVESFRWQSDVGVPSFVRSLNHLQFVPENSKRSCAYHSGHKRETSSFLEIEMPEIFCFTFTYLWWLRRCSFVCNFGIPFKSVLEVCWRLVIIRYRYYRPNDFHRHCGHYTLMIHNYYLQEFLVFIFLQIILSFHSTHMCFLSKNLFLFLKAHKSAPTPSSSFTKLALMPMI